MEIPSKSSHWAVERMSYWLLFHAALITGSLCWFFFAGSIIPLLLSSWISFAGMARATREEWRNQYWLGGPGNWITWLRLVLISVFLLLLPTASPLLLAGAGLLEILLDAFDGRLARRYGSTSLFGAYLDQEVDAFFVLVMSTGLYERGYAGAWILTLGLLRYLFVYVNHFLKTPRQEEVRSNYARIIAGIIMVGLPTAFLTPPWLYQPALPLLGLLLGYSFLRGFLEQVKSWRVEKLKG